MNEEIQGLGSMTEMLLAPMVKIVKGILSTNDIPKAVYYLNQSTLFICIYDTVVYKIQMPEVSPEVQIVFRIFIDGNKNIQILPIMNQHSAKDIISTMTFYGSIENLASGFCVSITNLKSDPEFCNLLAMKSADGMKLYKIPLNPNKSVFIPVFSGLFPLNKDDDCDIVVYPSEHGTFIIRTTIHKKKIKRDFDMYFRILDLQR